MQEFQSMGFTARAAGAYESRWNDIQDIMAAWLQHLASCLHPTQGQHQDRECG